MTKDGGLRTEDEGLRTRDLGRRTGDLGLRTKDGGLRTSYDIILFAILMVLLFMPLLQQHLLRIPLKPLNGVTLETEKPDFDLESYRSGDYAKQQEAYLSEHFGFREPVIRLYNQYLWTCYKKTYAKDVVAGKEGWLFYPQSVRDYYGTEMLLWYPSADEAREFFDREVKYLNWARAILKENGTELLAFIAPEKSFLYPEFIPDSKPDTSTFTAFKYFDERFAETGFPCIEMTRWFTQMKDTVDYPLIPQTGAHWAFTSVYAADSLFRFMGGLNGVELPRIKVGELHEPSKRSLVNDMDLEELLNLSFPLPHQYGFCPRAEVTIEHDSSTVKPKVLFVGNSYMWSICNFVPLDEVFDEVEFWYYFSTAYFGEGLSQTESVDNLNILEKLLDFDYVVWLTTGNQWNKGTMNFASTAVVNLCVNDSLLLAYMKPLSDSLGITLWEARNMILVSPEIIHELRGDSLPSLRNNELPYAHYTKDIRKDTAWMAALEAQAFLRTATMKQMLHAEVNRIKAGKPLYRDQLDEIRFARRCQAETPDMKERMRQNEKTMAMVKEKAEKYGKTLEQSLEDDAIWNIREKYGLNHCRLIDDPDAVIPLPLDFQSN